MIITTTRILHPMSKLGASSVEYKMPNGDPLTATKVGELLLKLQKAHVLPSDAWLGYLITDMQRGPLKSESVRRLEQPFYHLTRKAHTLSFITLTLTEFVHTEYDSDFHPLDLSQSLDELLRRVDYITEQPGGKELLQMERKAYLKEMKEDDVEDAFDYEKTIAPAKKAKRDEVLAYIAAL